jgi:hypothetical protein
VGAAILPILRAAGLRFLSEAGRRAAIEAINRTGFILIEEAAAAKWVQGGANAAKHMRLGSTIQKALLPFTPFGQQQEADGTTQEFLSLPNGEVALDVLMGELLFASPLQAPIVQRGIDRLDQLY